MRDIRATLTRECEDTDLAQDYRRSLGSRNTHNVVSIIFLSLVSISALVFCIVLLFRNAALEKEEEAVRLELEAINSEGYYTIAETEKMIEDAEITARVEATNSLKIRSRLSLKPETEQQLPSDLFFLNRLLWQAMEGIISFLSAILLPIMNLKRMILR